MRRYLALACALMSGCIWAATSTLLDEVMPDTVHTTDQHSCACWPDGKRTVWYWCDKDGNKNGKGPFQCCGICNTRCSDQRPAEAEPEPEAKPPVPIPVPECTLETHCKGKEECVIGDHKCCDKCHQPCP